MRLSRTVLAAGGALLLTLGMSEVSSALTLTGLTLFSADPQGNATKHYWNTVPLDISYNLWVGTGNLTAPNWITGMTNDRAAINIPLTNGSHTFNIYGDSGEDAGFFGLNLFFNGNTTTPGISVLLRSNGNPVAFKSNRGVTYSMNINPTPGSGGLSFGDTGVSLTSAYWLTQTGLDMVAPYTIGPSGLVDYMGQFSVVVGQPRTSVPESSPLAGLVTLGAVGLGLAFRKQQKQE